MPFTGESPVEIAMKHLTQPPEPPSTHRHEVPHDLDLVVLRALAKEPVDRYRSAQEMDHDLELVARGESVGTETAEAATMVLRGETTAVTAVVAPTRPAAAGGNGDERYRAYDGEVRARRPWWPWLLALGAALALGIGGYFVWDGLQDRIDANEPVAVDNYEGLVEAKAIELIRADGFEELVQREPNGEIEEGYVYEQEPAAGTRLPKGSIVTIVVSTGKPKVTVPPLVGKTRDEAVQELTALGLDVTVAEVNSSRPGGTVTAQDPAAGTVLVGGSTVRINVSKGPKQVAVPNVVGLQIDIATAQLNTAGFPVLPTQVESDRPEGEVVAQDPPGNSTTTQGATISLSVSQGPTTVAVPDVTLLPVGDARTTLARRGLPGLGRPPGHRRPVARRGRHLAGSRRRGAGRAGLPGDPDGRTVRRATADGDPAGRHDRDRDGSDGDDPDPVSRIRVAVLAGGRSSEHEISLASARSVVAALDPARYEATTIEIGRDGRWALPAAHRGAIGAAPAETLPVPADTAPTTLGAVDVVLPILHGPFGEDGTVQGLLELAGVPYVGSGVAASALCMDKDLFKAVLRDRGIPVAPNVTLRPGDPVENPYGYPVFVKPARLGSSVGISKVDDGGGARAGGRARAAPRRQGARRGAPAGGRGGVRRAREPRPDRLRGGRDRRARGLVRLRGEVRRRWHGAGRPRADLRGDRRARCAGSRSTRSSRPTARAWRASTSSCARTEASS